MRSLTTEIKRFLAVGVVNALLTFVIFTTLLKIQNIGYLISLFVSWFVGMIFSYCLNFKWVFGQPDRLAFGTRFIKFATSGLISISMNMISLRLLVEATDFDPFWVQTALIPPVVVFNFLTAKLWSFIRRDRST